MRSRPVGEACFQGFLQTSRKENRKRKKAKKPLGEEVVLL